MPIFKKTDKQKQAIKVLGSKSKHAMLFGGSRSGKSLIICYAIVIRAAKLKSRHLAARFKFNHAKTSLWYETFPKLFDLAFPDLPIKENKSDWFYQLPNGSEIWIGGLDEKERVEKILGKEYSTIFFNECSQIPYTSVSVALTRLAEQNNLKKRAYYDENPPTKRHWSYPLFLKGLDPDTWEPRKDSGKYTHLLMNPQDNIENIDADYIELLEQLPEKERKRFLEGEFTDDSNTAIYYAFDREKNVKKIERDKKQYIWVGMDFNINPMTAVVCQSYNDKIYVLDEFFIMSSDTAEMGEEIIKKYGRGLRVVPDSTGKRKQTSSSGWSDHEILRSLGFVVVSSNNPFRIDRYNTVNNLLEKERIIINPRCVKLIKDLEQVSYKEGSSLPETSKDSTLTHISDALGYLCWYHYPILKPSTEVRQIR